MRNHATVQTKTLLKVRLLCVAAPECAHAFTAKNTEAQKTPKYRRFLGTRMDMPSNIKTWLHTPVFCGPPPLIFRCKTFPEAQISEPPGMFCAAFFKLFVFFSTRRLVTMIIWPQPLHFKRKSAPTRKISHSWLPHGWGFFNLTISPTS